jgi:hypothetical protein
MAGSVGVMKTEAESPPSEDEAVFDEKPVTFTQVRLIFFRFFLWLYRFCGYICHIHFCIV